jgi:hypothetical protein
LDNSLANASEHIITGTVCAGVVALLLFIIVSTLRGRHRRAEIARLQRDVRLLSEDVTALQAAEQRRFYKEINLPGDEAGAPSTAASPPLETVVVLNRGNVKTLISASPSPETPQ